MQGGQGQAHVIQEVTNCVVMKNQSQYSLTDLEPPPCELSNDVGINTLGCPLQEIRLFPMSSPFIADFSSRTMFEVMHYPTTKLINLFW